MGNLRYCHVVERITPEMKSALEEIPSRGGMYNWLFVHKGCMRTLNDLRASGDFEKYDVLQVNLSPVDQMIIKELRDTLPKSSSTLLIGNNDYVTESWDSWGQHPLQYQHYQGFADGVFGTEPYQVSNMIEGAYCIPHPHRIEVLKRIGNDDLELDKFKIGILYHWWEGRSYHQSLLMSRLRAKYPKLVSRVYGYYRPDKDKSAAWARVMFDNMMPLMQFPAFMRSLMTNRLILEQCSYHTYGRTTVDTAALGIPSIGTDRVFSMRHCWKNMCCDPFDQKKLLELADKVLKGGEWLQEQVDYARESCEYFNYDNSRQRYLAMVEDVRKRVGK